MPSSLFETIVVLGVQATLLASTLSAFLASVGTAAEIGGIAHEIDRNRHVEHLVDAATIRAGLGARGSRAVLLESRRRVRIDSDLDLDGRTNPRSKERVRLEMRNDHGATLLRMHVGAQASTLLRDLPAGAAIVSGAGRSAAGALLFEWVSIRAGAQAGALAFFTVPERR